MRGFILTETERDETPGAEGRSWAELARDHPLLSRRTETYLATILDGD